MARLYGIKKRLEDKGIKEKLKKEIIGNGDLIGIIERMEKLLDFEMMYEILDSCGCGGGKEYIKKCEKAGKETADKTLEEKVNYFSNEYEYYKITLNDANTFTVKMSFENNGKYGCVCSAVVKNGVRVSDFAVPTNNSDDRIMPLSYCFCCAGSSRNHLQLKLGVSLKTKEIISSPINSRGEKPCEFIFEIL
jgi:hypothetical protein